MSTDQISAQLLGDYEVRLELGQGMLGKGFLAQHRFLKKKVILKELPEELASDSSFIERFEREVSILASLDHPHIVKIENAICIESRYYLVTECPCDSNGTIETLETLLQRNKRLSETTILRIASQTAKALEFAHQVNVYDEPFSHRGLRPNAIFLTGELPNLHIKLGDFGLSRIVGIAGILPRTYRILWETFASQAGFEQGDAYLERFFEEEGDIKGLYEAFSKYYAFLAPEQKSRGESSQEQDVKGDIYSFGVLLYYLLVGTYPEGFFPMPSECRLDLEYNWDGIIQACLAVDPEKRPQNISDLIGKNCKNLKEARVQIKPGEIARPEYESDPAAVFQIDKTVVTYTPVQADVSQIEPIKTEMVVLEGGTFLRGCNHGARDEMPRHAVHLPPFAIDVHPTTNEQFVRFLTVMGGEKDANNNDIIRLRDSRIRKNGGKLTIESGYAKHPIVGVTWYGAMAYAKWVGKRLPTEAEWELAAYGGLEGASYPTGDDIERSQANFFNSDTTAVMSYPENGMGLFDMSGNVYEWCYDWYGYHYYETSMQEPEKPQGPVQGVYRVLRGGCWKSLKEDMRCSHRHRNNPGVMNSTYGFRCAADVG